MGGERLPRPAPAARPAVEAAGSGGQRRPPAPRCPRGQVARAAGGSGDSDPQRPLPGLVPGAAARPPAAARRR